MNRNYCKNKINLVWVGSMVDGSYGNGNIGIGMVLVSAWYCIEIMKPYYCICIVLLPKYQYFSCLWDGLYNKPCVSDCLFVICQVNKTFSEA